MVSLQSLPAQLPFGQKKEAISPLEIFSAIDEDNRRAFRPAYETARPAMHVRAQTPCTHPALGGRERFA